MPHHIQHKLSSRWESRVQASTAASLGCLCRPLLQHTPSHLLLQRRERQRLVLQTVLPHKDLQSQLWH